MSLATEKRLQWIAIGLACVFCWFAGKQDVLWLHFLSAAIFCALCDWCRNWGIRKGRISAVAELLMKKGPTQ